MLHNLSISYCFISYDFKQWFIDEDIHPQNLLLKIEYIFCLIPLFYLTTSKATSFRYKQSTYSLLEQPFDSPRPLNYEKRSVSPPVVGSSIICLNICRIKKRNYKTLQERKRIHRYPLSQVLLIQQIILKTKTRTAALKIYRVLFNKTPPYTRNVINSDSILLQSLQT